MSIYICIHTYLSRGKGAPPSNWIPLRALGVHRESGPLDIACLLFQSKGRSSSGIAPPCQGRRISSSVVCKCDGR